MIFLGNSWLTVFLPFCFSCNRKDLSVKYPGDLPITLPNLLRFILHHSDPASAPQGLTTSPPTQECAQSAAVLQREHISHVENAMQELRSEMSSLRRTQEQVEGRLFSARRDGHRLLRRQRTLEQQHRLLRRHSQKLQALYLKKARELQELASASETPSLSTHGSRSLWQLWRGSWSARVMLRSQHLWGRLTPTTPSPWVQPSYLVTPLHPLAPAPLWLQRGSMRTGQTNFGMR